MATRKTNAKSKTDNQINEATEGVTLEQALKVSLNQEATAKESAKDS